MLIIDDKQVQKQAATLAAIRSAVLAKRDVLREALALRTWRATDGTVAPEEVQQRSAKWPSVTLPHDWLAKSTAKTMYHALHIPADFLGISLLGQRVDLLMWSLIGTVVYANDRVVYSADYWADTQVVPVTLCGELDAATDINLVAQMRQGSGFGFFLSAELSIPAIDEWRFLLDTFAEELDFAQFLAESNPQERWLRDDLHDALGLFDTAALEQNRWDRVAEGIAALRQRLAHFSEKAKQYKVRLVGHAHIDMNWLWPYSETVDVIRRDFESVSGIMRDFPQVRFSHSQAATYKIIQDEYPALWQQVKEHIAAGRWEVTAATWVEGDLNMGGYETLARQFLLGKSYARQELGVDPQLCWEPDTFGHPASMPQLLRLAGIKYYYHTRAGQDVPVFWWEGIDGSRVLVFNDPNGYNGRIYASNIVSSSKNMARRYGLQTNMFVYGIGDHGGGVTRQDVRRAIELDKSPLLPRFEFSKAADFYKELEQSGGRFPVIKGELNTVFEGCYTSHGDIKRAMRAAEHELVRAEALVSSAAIVALGAGRAPLHQADSDLTRAWRTQCFNQFHDILCGCAIGPTYDLAVPQQQEIIAQARRLGTAALDSILQRGDQGSTTLTVFNSLSWERSDIVSLRDDDLPQARDWQSGDWLVDEGGEGAMLQRNNDELLFVATNVPAFGAKTYSYQKGGAAHDEVSSTIGLSPNGNPILRNARYEIEVDQESGTIVGLTDVYSGREISTIHQDRWVEAPHNKGLLNLFEMQYEAPHTMSAWQIGTIARTDRLIRDATVSVAAQGPVFQSLRIAHKIGRSVIEQEMRVYRTLERIDFITRVDWQEEGSTNSDSPMLRVLFTANLRAAAAHFDIPFAAISRERDGREVPALHWVDLSEPQAGENYGLAVLNNGKYGCAVQGNTISLSLLRSPYEPDTHPDIGEHHFTYSLLPHRGDWRAAQVGRHGWALNQPLLALSGSAKDGTSVLTVQEFGSSDWQAASAVIVTALKPASDAQPDNPDFIVRLVETAGRKTRVRVLFAAQVLAAEEVNLLEDHLRPLTSMGQTVDLDELQPWEVRTLRVRLDRAA